MVQQRNVLSALLRLEIDSQGATLKMRSLLIKKIIVM